MCARLVLERRRTLWRQVKALSDAQVDPDSVTAESLHKLGHGSGTAHKQLTHLQMVTPGQPLHVVYRGSKVHTAPVLHIVRREFEAFARIRLNSNVSN